MIIRPFLPDADSMALKSKANKYHSAKTDVSYIQSKSPLNPGYLIVSKKMLTDIGEARALVKIVFVYEIKYTFDQGPFTEDISTKEELNSVNYVLNLKTVTTGAFAPGNKFANIVYKIDDDNVASHMEFELEHYTVFGFKRFNKKELVENSRKGKAVHIVNDFPLRFIIKTVEESESERPVPQFLINTDLKTVLANCGQFSFTSYNSDSFESSNTFSESNLLMISYDRYVMDKKPIKESDINSVAVIQDMLSDFLATLVKPYLLSNTDDISFIIDTSILTDKGLGMCPAFTIKNHRNPFGKFVVPQYVELMCKSFYEGAMKAVIPITDMFGDIRLVVHICDGFFSVFCRFLEEDPPVFVDIPIEEIKVMQSINQTISRHFMILTYGSDYVNRYMRYNFENVGNLLNYYR